MSALSKSDWVYRRESRQHGRCDVNGGEEEKRKDEEEEDEEGEGEEIHTMQVSSE